MCVGTGLCCDEFRGQLLEGQSFLCVTLDATQLNAAADLLTLPSLFLYDWHLPAWTPFLYPAIPHLVLAGKDPSVTSCCFSQSISLLVEPV